MIPHYKLVRVMKSPKGTAGVLFNPSDVPICNTVERPQKGNEVDISCILEGTYPAHRRMRHAGEPDEYEVFQLEKVPGRTVIQIHIANYPTQLNGCIAPVTSWWEGKDMSGTNSTGAFNRFMGELKGIDRIWFEVTSSCIQTADISPVITNLER